MQKRAASGPLWLSGADSSRYRQAALIVTRLDANEQRDPRGTYRIDVVSTAGAER
jgi:hypothetical protein